MKCSDCKFWKERHRDGYTGNAPCVRFPPQRDPSHRDGWDFPQVSPHAWCGEHQPKQSEE